MCDKMGFWTLEISFHIRPVANMSVMEGREEERGLDWWNGWMESANSAKHVAVSRFCWLEIDQHNPTIFQLNKEYLFDVMALDRNVIWSWAFKKTTLVYDVNAAIHIWHSATQSLHCTQWNTITKLWCRQLWLIFNILQKCEEDNHTVTHVG